MTKFSNGIVAGRLAGKVAFITGTGGGQGRAAALMFAAAGAVVLGCDHNEAQNQQTADMAKSQGLDIFTTTIDCSDPVLARDWINEGVKEFKKIDALYNNAGFAHFAPIEMMTSTQWSETLRYELDIVFYPTQAAWKHMAALGGGSIVNIASVSGMRATEKLPALAHATGKGGIISLTRQLALEGAPQNIRVNSISPGPILTPVTKAAIEADPEMRAAFESWPRLGRVGQPEDVAYAALFLASDESAWITGSNLVVDGGWSI